MPPMLNIAIIGCGGIAKVHARAYSNLRDRAKVIAVADIDYTAAKELAGITGAEPVTNYRELLSRADVDAVDICLPHHLHKQVIIESLRAEKHAMCEKPMCLTTQEADEILAAIKDSKRMFMPAHNQVFTRGVQEAKGLLNAGELGRVLFVSTQDCFVNSGITGWRTKKAQLGGGELIDTGYHPTYLLNFLSGSRPRTVYALGARHRIRMEGEDTAFIALGFEDGSLGSIHSSWAYENPNFAPLFSVVCESGQLTGGQNNLAVKNISGETRTRAWPSNGDSFRSEIEHFIDCVETNAIPLQTAEDGKRALSVIQAAYRSIELGLPVTLS